jgi:retron-type reverse transcriptase
MDAIAQVIEDFSKAKETKQAILAIFFDFAKAFDLVPHDKLLHKLKRYLPQWLTSWIAAYLRNRKQRVVYNQTKTEWKSVEAGVIQGSVLGPILFLLFIHDINEILPNEIELEKYADDTDLHNRRLGPNSQHHPPKNNRCNKQLV